MAEGKRKNYFFEAGPASGVLVYVIDEDEPVCMKFSTAIRIKVLFDSSDTGPVGSDVKKDEIPVPFNLPVISRVESQARDSEIAAEISVGSESGDSKVAGGGEAEEEIESHGAAREEDNLNDVADKVKGKSQRRKRQASRVGNKSGKSEPPRKQARREASAESSHVKDSSDSGDGDTDEESAAQNDSSGDAEGTKSKSGSKISSRKLKSSSKKVGKLNLKRKTKVKTSKLQKTALQSENVTQVTQETPSEDGAEEDTAEAENESGSQVRPKKLLMQKVVKCEYCEVEFRNQQAYYDHRRAWVSKHVCGICGKSEPYEAHLIVHMQRHRRAKAESDTQSSKLDSNGLEGKDAKTVSNKRKNKKEKMKCNLCDLVVSSMDSLKIHTMLHTGECAYRCCVCGENFSSLSSRQHHMDTHVSSDRFKCLPCGQRFASRADLAKHQLTHEIKCALCGEIFPNKTSRTCHYRVAHPDDILKCSLCSKMYATSEDLQKHMIYHRKGRKEQCPECGVVVSKLKDHMVLHTQSGQEKMFVCDQCPMRYLRKSNLYRHMRTHTGEKPYACNHCTKCFRSNGMLRKHLLTHTQERPYQCEVCGKRCSLRSNLTIHMRIHSSDKHYQCTLCPQAFNHKNSLHSHMKNKHSREMNLNMSDNTIQLDMPTHPPPPPPPPPNMVPEMDKSLTLDPNDPHLQLGLQVGMGASLGHDLLKPEDHQNYNPMQMQMVYSDAMTANMSSNILMDADRMAVKYELQSQVSHTHGY